MPSTRRRLNRRPTCPALRAYVNAIVTLGLWRSKLHIWRERFKWSQKLETSRATGRALEIVAVHGVWGWYFWFKQTKTVFKTKSQTVVYFQIVGTHNTANEVFHAVHFESPAQPETESLRPSREHHNHHHRPPSDHAANESFESDEQ